MGVLATAWSALYMHGGFALLPVIAIVLLLARPNPRGVAITLGVALLFLLHYHRVHYQPEEGVGATVPVWEWLYGFCLLVAGMLYHLLVGPVGPVGAGVGAVALALTVVGVSAGLALKTVQRKATALDLIALVFMGYALLLALAAVVVRARVFGWEYVLASRYSSMSIFAAVGLLLAWWNRVRQGGLTGCSALIRPAGLATLVALFFLLVLGMLDFLRGLPPRNNSVQTYMIPYTLEPWSLPAAGMTNPRRMRSAAYMRDRLVANNKGVFGSRAYQCYRDFQPDALAAPVPTGKGARAEVTYIESQGEHQLLHLKIQAGEPGVRGGYLWIVLVDGQKAGWALPVNDVIGFPAPGPASPRVASGFSLARATNHTLRAILLNHAGVPLLQTEDCRIGNAPAPSGPMARSQG
jgi:hypothetical protein